MGDATKRLLELRPVVFRYKEEQTLPSGEVPVEYGLIAEEVAEIFPDLVVYDEEGKPFTVKYHLLSSMLLNELKRMHQQLEAERATHERLETERAMHERELSDLRKDLAAQCKQHAREIHELRGRLDALESRSTPVALSPANAGGSR